MYATSLIFKLSFHRYFVIKDNPINSLEEVYENNFATFILS